VPAELLRSALASISPDPASPQIATDALRRMVHSTRIYLNMDVAYVSELVGRRAIFREVDAPAHENLLAVGESYIVDSGPLLDGMPMLSTQESLFPHTRGRPAAWNLPVSTTLSAPIRLRDGTLYGEFRCLSFLPRPALGERDLDIVRIFADLIALQVDRALTADRDRDAKREKILAILQGDAFSIVLQPIMRLEDSTITSFESLSRFSAEPRRGPDVWFREADEVGLGLEPLP
jgi:GAF domain-containing protein